MPENDPLDRLIDSALGTYANPDSESELARRALVRIAAEGGRRRTRRWLPWIIALPVAASLLILMTFFGSKPTRRTASGTNQARVSQPARDSAIGAEPLFPAHSAATQHAGASRPQTRASHVVSIAKTSALPKLDIFPTPQPLTPEEQTFATYAARASEKERESLIEAQKQMEEPLSIAAIQIQPLKPSEPDGN